MSADGPPFMVLDGVSLRYGGEAGVLALHDATLHVTEGEFVAVVGPSGCGKSSLMKLMTGLLPPSAGTLMVAGQALTGPLKIAGMAFQNATLLPWRSVLDNVMLPLEIVQPHRARLGRDRAAYRARARALLNAVGLAGFEDSFPWALSGGMQQRVSLCRALVHEPRLLMLDEPFAALDSFTREELWSVLQGLWIERRFTCLLVTHDLREAAFLADRVLVMSARPAHVVAGHTVDLPRPRTLDDTYTPKFIATVQVIRQQIGMQRRVSA